VPRRGGHIAYTCDLAHRLTSITPAGGSTTTLSLEALGRPTTRTTGSSVDTYSYLGTSDTAGAEAAAAEDVVLEIARIAQPRVAADVEHDDVRARRQAVDGIRHRRGAEGRRLAVGSRQGERLRARIRGQPGAIELPGRSDSRVREVPGRPGIEERIRRGARRLVAGGVVVGRDHRGQDAPGVDLRLREVGVEADAVV